MRLHIGLTPARAASALAVLFSALLVLTPCLGQFRSAHEAMDFRNLQRINAAFQNYVHDNDETFPVFFQNIVGGVCLPNAPQVCGYRSMWQFHIFPYLGDWSVMRSPSDVSTNDPVYEAFNVSYGYNYGYLGTLCFVGSWQSQELGCPPADPGNRGASQFYTALKRSEVLNPARIVSIAGGGGRDFLRPTSIGSFIDPPDAWPSQKTFYGADSAGWGKRCRNLFRRMKSFDSLVNFGSWGDTDGFAPRYDGGANMVFIDGHADWQATARAAAGTNWTPTSLCDNDDLLVTDYSKYEWDPRYDEGTQRHF